MLTPPLAPGASRLPFTAIIKPKIAVRPISSSVRSSFVQLRRSVGYVNGRLTDKGRYGVPMTFLHKERQYIVLRPAPARTHRSWR